jgi:hypothetical protein
MSTRTYEELVAAGQRIIGGHQWELGDLACELETNYRERDLAKFATEIGQEFRSLEQYRTVARAYKNPERSGNLSWSLHMVFASQADRLELLARPKPWTVAEARALVTSRREPIIPSPPNPVTPTTPTPTPTPTPPTIIDLIEDPEEPDDDDLEQAAQTEARYFRNPYSLLAIELRNWGSMLERALGMDYEPGEEPERDADLIRYAKNVRRQLTALEKKVGIS